MPTLKANLPNVTWVAIELLHPQIPNRLQIEHALVLCSDSPSASVRDALLRTHARTSSNAQVAQVAYNALKALLD